MTPTDNELMRAMETGMLRMPTVRGQFEKLDMSFAMGNFSPKVSNELVNNVGDFNIPEANRDAVIEQILAHYQALGNSACWWTGPSMKPAGLLWMTSVRSAPPHLHGVNYAAYLEGVDGAISVACLFIIPGTEIAMFAGASTLMEYRGNGAYTALLAARFRDAAEFGAKAVIIQANSTTSSPICQRAGMRKLCELQLFISGPN